MTKHRKRDPATGRPVRTCPQAAHNARTHKVAITTGGQSVNLLRAPLDERTRAGKAYRRHVQTLERHLGGDLTAPQSRLVDQAARLALIAELAWAQIRDGGVFNKKGDVRPALDAYHKAIREERAILQLLGIERRQKPLPDLQEYISKHGQEDIDD